MALKEDNKFDETAYPPREDNPETVAKVQQLLSAGTIKATEVYNAEFFNQITTKFNTAIDLLKVLTAQAITEDLDEWSAENSLAGVTITAAQQPYNFIGQNSAGQRTLFQLGSNVGLRADVTFGAAFNGAGQTRETLETSGQLYAIGLIDRIEDDPIISLAGGDVSLDHSIIPKGKLRLIANTSFSANNPYKVSYDDPSKNLMIRNGEGNEVITRGSRGAEFIAIEPSQVALVGFGGVNDDELFVLYNEKKVFQWDVVPTSFLEYDAKHIFNIDNDFTVTLSDASSSIYGLDFEIFNEGSGAVTINSAQLSQPLVLEGNGRRAILSNRQSAGLAVYVDQTFEEVSIMVDADVTQITSDNANLVYDVPFGTDPEANEIAIYSVKYYDIGTTRKIYAEVGLYDDDDTDLTFGANLIPAGAKIFGFSVGIVNPTTNGTADNEKFSYYRLSDNEVRLNRDNSFYAGNQIVRMEITVEGVPETKQKVTSIPVGNGDIDNPIENLYLQSPNGNKWKLSVSDTGILSTTAV